MNNYIDKKLIVSMVIVAVIVFFLTKWFTKKLVKPTGETSSYVGHEAVGFV